MALLVAQTRVESGIHTTSEVVLGAVIGTLVTMILFQVLMTDRELLAQAQSASANAYAPCSNFHVGRHSCATGV